MTLGKDDILTKALASIGFKNLTNKSKYPDDLTSLLANSVGKIYPLSGDVCAAFGDSFTNGVGASTEEFGYRALLEKELRWTIVNKGISGGETPDMAAVSVLPTIVGKNSRFVGMFGLNDMRHSGASTQGLQTYRNTMTAMLAWLALPHGNKIQSDDASVTKTGTWATSPLYDGAINSSYSSTAASTITFPVLGTAVYVGYTNRAGSSGGQAGGSFDVLVDGRKVNPAPISTSTGLVPGNSARAFWPEAYRVAGLAPGPHNVQIVIAAGGGIVNIDWVGTNTGAGFADSPLVFAGNTARMSSAGYVASGNAAFNNGSNAAVIQYNIVLQELIRTLAKDGLGVNLVDSSIAYNPDNAGEVSADNIHPLNGGYASIASAFASRINGVLGTADPVSLPDVNNAWDHALATETGDRVSYSRKGSVVMAANATSLVLTNPYIRLTPLSVVNLTIHGAQGGAGVNPRFQITGDGAAIISLGTSQASVLRIMYSIE